MYRYSSICRMTLHSTTRQLHCEFEYNYSLSIQVVLLMPLTGWPNEIETNFILMYFTIRNVEF